MIQYYINNRPVPRAIARHHLIEACPDIAVDFFPKIFDGLKNNYGWAVKFCASYGVSVATI